MASRTYTSGGAATGSNSNSLSSPVSPDTAVRCTAHQRKCSRFTAGPKTKNPGRPFYCCPLPKGDASRCKFFQWVDEVPISQPSHPTPSKQPTTPSSRSYTATLARGPSSFVSAGQTLGQSPQKPYCTPTSSRNVRLMPVRPMSARSGSVPSVASDDDGGIDWENIDMDRLEEQAIRSSQESAKKAVSRGQGAGSREQAGPGTGTVGTVGAVGTPKAVQRSQTLVETPGSATRASFVERMKEVLASGSGSEKRERAEGDEEDERTPKRVNVEPSNPFISPSVMSPPHAELLPTVSSLEQLSEHLHRQDRLVRAAEVMKQGMRKTIKNLQERNKELEARVKELEARVEGR